MVFGPFPQPLPGEELSIKGTWSHPPWERWLVIPEHEERPTENPVTSSTFLILFTPRRAVRGPTNTRLNRGATPVPKI